MDKQEIINNVVPRLLAQGPAADKDGTCLYRAEVNGQTRMCAVGMLLKDEFYQKSFECKRPGLPESGLLDQALRDSGVTVEMDFLHRLQSCHDEAVTSEDKGQFRIVDDEEFRRLFTRNIQRFCVKEGLTSPV